MVKRFMCIKVLHEDGEHASPTHCRVVAAIDYDALEVNALRELALLQARLAEAERDAARYRWLRDKKHPSLGLTRLVLNDTPHGIDAAIDAAMGEKP